MTVCIAALYGDGQGVVMASDRMVTAHIPIGYEFEHEEATKIVRLVDTSSTHVLLSGDVLRGHEVVDMALGPLTQATPPIAVADIADHVRSCYQTIRRNCVIQQELEPRGFDLVTFNGMQQQLMPAIVQIIDQSLSNFDLNVEMLIAGDNATHHTVYSIMNPGIVRDHSPIGHGAIGSGAPHALYSLIEAKYRPSMPKEQVVELVSNAKKRSEVAPGVGEGTSIVTIPNQEPLP